MQEERNLLARSSLSGSSELFEKIFLFLWLLLSKFLNGVLDSRNTLGNVGIEILLNSIPSFIILRSKCHVERLRNKSQTSSEQDETREIGYKIRIVRGPVSLLIIVFQEFNEVTASFHRGTRNGREENVSSFCAVNHFALVDEGLSVPVCLYSVHEICHVRENFGKSIVSPHSSIPVEIIAVLLPCRSHFSSEKISDRFPTILIIIIERIIVIGLEL